MIAIATALFFAIGAALFAGLAGWMAGSRQATAGRAVTESLRAQLDSVVVERDQARAAIEDARAAHATLQAELAAVRAGEVERSKAFEARLAEIREARDAMAAQFSDIGAKLLHEAQARFLERAGQRFEESETRSGERLKALLTPVHDRLQRYEEQVGRIEKERTEAYGDIKATIEQVRAGAERVQAEANRLVTSLRNAPKARGRWGEQQLRNVLESCGLAEHVDFVMEQSVTTEDGRLRPDAVVRIPGGQTLVIDAKVSLNAYQDAFDAADEAARADAMLRHCASMRAHVESLARKAYWNQFESAPDYVIMFVPGEHFLAAALEHEPQLWDLAFDKRVLLATPTNLVAIARTVAGVWRQEKMADQAREIGLLGKELYERLAVAAQHLRTMGSGLGTAVANYNKFVGSFERNIMSSGRKFKVLNIDTGARELGELTPLEALPRYADEAAQ